MNGERDAVKIVAELMTLSARTAPKGKGIDSIVTKVVLEDNMKELAEEMRRIAYAQSIKFFLRDAKNIEMSDACLLIGTIGTDHAGLDCGGCGFSTCNGMLEAQKAFTTSNKSFRGPNCVIKISDLGIALGSAAKTASLHNVDNRIMFSAGVAAIALGWLDRCHVAYGLPLKASGKNIYFDRQN